MKPEGTPNFFWQEHIGFYLFKVEQFHLHICLGHSSVVFMLYVRCRYTCPNISIYMVEDLSMSYVQPQRNSNGEHLVAVLGRQCHVVAKIHQWCGPNGGRLEEGKSFLPRSGVLGKKAR